MKQGLLFSGTNAHGDVVLNPEFDGAVYDPAVDKARLTAQMKRVYGALAGGAWLTLAEIAEKTGDPEASVSAQVRHLRKARFGGHQVDKRRRGEASRGVWEYRLVVRGLK